jgi:hypothetical protein
MPPAWEVPLLISWFPAAEASSKQANPPKRGAVNKVRFVGGSVLQNGSVVKKGRRQQGSVPCWELLGLQGSDPGAG